MPRPAKPVGITRKRLPMKNVLLKLIEEKPGIGLEPRQQKQVKYTKETTLKLTTLDTIGLVALITLGLLLSQSMRIELDNQRDTE